MSEERTVPGPAAENNERITSRPYESDFYRLPADETTSVERPGAGLRGTVGDGPSKPVLTIVIGFALLFVTFVVQHWIWLLIGFGLILLGGGWSVVKNRSGSHKGLGATVKTNR